MAVLLALAFAACSGDDGRPKLTDATKPWIETVVEDPSTLRQETHDGETVWVDEENQVIYSEDCKVTDALSKVEGAKYGAQPRDADGEGGANGYGSVCKT